MVANDNAGNLTPRGALGFFASMLAPTWGQISNQVGCQAASLLIVIWFLIFLAPSRGFVPVLRSG
jgi:hypothetical protein